jgi:polysaccharide biosynthesis/export protein
MQRLLQFALFVLLGILPGCSLTSAGKPMGQLAPEINATLTQSELILAPGDVLSVVFPRLNGWDQAAITIQADGKASFLSLGIVHTSGLTIPMLSDKLRTEYGKFLAQPDLTVRVIQPAPRTVVLMGEVIEGGSFALPAGRLSLLEAFGLAQGAIRDTAKLNHTMLVRWIPEENRVQSWKIDASVDEWGAEESILLQAHDVIFVPAKPVVHVNDWIDRYIRRNLPVPYLTFVQ